MTANVDMKDSNAHYYVNPWRLVIYVGKLGSDKEKYPAYTDKQEKRKPKGNK